MAKFTQDVGERLVNVGRVDIEVSLEDIKNAVSRDEIVQMAAEVAADDPSGFLGDLAICMREVEAECLIEEDDDKPTVKLVDNSNEPVALPRY